MRTQERRADDVADDRVPRVAPAAPSDGRIQVGDLRSSDAAVPLIFNLSLPPPLLRDSVENHVFAVSGSVAAKSSTELSFVMPEAEGLTATLHPGGKVTLDVLDVAGRRIATIFSGPRSPGKSTFRWSRARTPAGVYLAQLRSGGQTVVRKFILVN